MIVLDTNVVSELMRATPSPAVLTWLADQPRAEVTTTAITVAEVRYGIARLPAGRRRNDLLTAAADVFGEFAAQVLAFDAAAALAYADLVADCERHGHQLNAFDAQIAAICRVRSARLATRSVKDFKGTGADVVDPWASP